MSAANVVMTCYKKPSFTVDVFMLLMRDHLDMIAACCESPQLCIPDEALNQKLNSPNLSCGLETISDSCPG